jgi:hypothetical protein
MSLLPMTEQLCSRALLESFVYPLPLVVSDPASSFYDTKINREFGKNCWNLNHTRTHVLNLTVSALRYDLRKTTEEEGGVDFKVIDYMLHPQYDLNNTERGSDIALLQIQPLPKFQSNLNKLSTISMDGSNLGNIRAADATVNGIQLKKELRKESRQSEMKVNPLFDFPGPTRPRSLSDHFQHNPAKVYNTSETVKAGDGYQPVGKATDGAAMLNKLKQVITQAKLVINTLKNTTSNSNATVYTWNQNENSNMNSSLVRSLLPFHIF